MDSIHQYGLIESEAEGISRFGDTTSNQAEQMNASIEEARIMPPITMIKHVAIKYSEKATSCLIGARRLLDGGHVIHPYIKKGRRDQNEISWMDVSKIVHYGSRQRCNDLVYCPKECSILSS